MTAERMGLGVMAVACVGLIGWNMSLSSQLTDLQAQKAEVKAAQAERPAAVVAGEPGERPDRMKARKAGGGWNQLGERPGRPDMGGERSAGDAEQGERRERRQRDWGAIRADMETKTIDTVEAYGATHGWEESTTDDVLNILLDTSDAIADVWTQASAGDLTHYQARKEMMTIRQGSADDIIAMIGEPAYEGLDEHLWEARHDVMRASHDRGSEGDGDNK